MMQLEPQFLSLWKHCLDYILVLLLMDRASGVHQALQAWEGESMPQRLLLHSQAGAFKGSPVDEGLAVTSEGSRNTQYETCPANIIPACPGKRVTGLPERQPKLPRVHQHLLQSSPHAGWTAADGPFCCALCQSRCMRGPVAGPSLLQSVAPSTPQTESQPAQQTAGVAACQGSLWLADSSVGECFFEPLQSSIRPEQCATNATGSKRRRNKSCWVQLGRTF